jgi:hypothetical protein
MFLRLFFLTLLSTTNESLGFRGTKLRMGALKEYTLDYGHDRDISFQTPFMVNWIFLLVNSHIDFTEAFCSFSIKS